jgi:hypothetical protein
MKLTLKPEGLAVRLRGKMVEIYDFPDGRLEVRWKGRSLPYSAFDKLQRVSHAAIVENKRLGTASPVSTEFRMDRDDRARMAQARRARPDITLPVGSTTMGTKTPKVAIERVSAASLRGEWRRTLRASRRSCSAGQNSILAVRISFSRSESGSREL